MNKKETATLEQILTNCKALNDENKKKVMWITEGMALVGGGQDGKHDRR